MGDRRERLKNAGSRSGAKRTKDKRKTKGKTRESVGGALGLTPRHPKRRNLTVAKAAEAAAAAAVKLDELEVAERSVRKERTSEKGIYEGCLASILTDLDEDSPTRVPHRFRRIVDLMY